MAESKNVSESFRLVFRSFAEQELFGDLFKPFISH